MDPGMIFCVGVLKGGKVNFVDIFTIWFRFLIVLHSIIWICYSTYFFAKLPGPTRTGSTGRNSQHGMDDHTYHGLTMAHMGRAQNCPSTLDRKKTMSPEWQADNILSVPKRTPNDWPTAWFGPSPLPLQALFWSSCRHCRHPALPWGRLDMEWKLTSNAEWTPCFHVPSRHSCPKPSLCKAWW